jgi:hemerythrin-like metal-binding protein
VKELSVDLEQLGEQHDHFYGLTVQLGQYIAQGRSGRFDPAELVRMVLAFRHYAFYHFHAEEVFMIGQRFPGYFTHKDDHNQYLERVNSYLSRLERTYHDVNAGKLDGNRLLDLAEEINTYVALWWKEHISTIDERCVSFCRGMAA